MFYKYKIMKSDTNDKNTRNSQIHKIENIFKLTLNKNELKS